MKRTGTASGVGRWFAMGWALFALQSLANCSGSTTHGGDTPGNTAGTNAGKGGNSGGGNSSTDGGTYNGAGTSGDAGMSGYVGYGGHTAGCFTNPCLPFCGLRPGCGGTNSGGTNDGGTSNGGSINNASGAPAGGETGYNAGGEAGAGGAAPAKRLAPAQRAAVRSGERACYQLSGFENDACLPADDTLLTWLSPLPTGCTPTVLQGPELTANASGRACCYAVGCGAPAR